MPQACPGCGGDNDDDVGSCFTCGQQLLQAIQLGQVVGGRYEILSRLGRGGMGTVYRAHDRVLEEDVALKVLRESATGTTDAARRFRLEIKLARRVIHRNVCRIFEYGEEPGRRFISMELVEGRDLKQAIAQAGRLPLDRGLTIAIQLADGLDAIHQVGVVHRDLKTANIMLDHTGTVRLMDFGIAKNVAPDAAAATGSGELIGTPSYMSPEQARGEKVDFRSDIYSLGVVLFELFTGRVPFEGDTPWAIIHQHINDPPPLAEGPAASALPPEVTAILKRALAKARDARFQSAAELAQALRAAAASAEPGVSGAGSAVTLRPWSSDAGASQVRTAVEKQTQVLDGSPDTEPPLEATLDAGDVAGRTGTVAGTVAATVHAGPQSRPARRRVAVVMGAALVLAAGFGILGRRATPPAADPLTVASTVQPAPAVLPVPPGMTMRVTLNALPWARVTLKARVPAGPAGPGGTLVTPVAVALAPGTYVVELENGGLTQPASREIQVAPGGRNEFVFLMPSFDPAAAARDAVEAGR